MLKKTWFGKFIWEVYNSFNDKDGTGFDERKLSGFAVIMVSVIIGLTYAHNIYNCKTELSWDGVLLVLVFLLFGALYLMILNPKQILEILSVIYNKNTDKTSSSTTTIDEGTITKTDETTTKETVIDPENK